MSRGDFAPFAARMRAEQLPDVVIRTFAHYYDQLVAGQTGLIPERDIEPVTSLPDYADLDAGLEAAGSQALSHTVLLKLNGGLGTSMGLAQAKSLLTVKSGLTFLDIIARQAQLSGVPLLLMNSFSTRDDSLAALQDYTGLSGDLPLDFLQHKVPKVVQQDLSPANWPDDPNLEWCPPGHGDLYTALDTSGMLDRLLAAGYRYAFVSNSDNLGAVIDTRILGHFVRQELPFMMEVCHRSEADRKGGHLAQLADGQLILRESAQCPDEDEASFQDITRHRYFNTNSLWIDLAALKQRLIESDGVLGLALIRNRKTVDPRDKTSTPVFQLETAMGAAIAVFPGAGALRVPKARFAPIKTTNDLLDIRSDNYILTDRYQVVANPARRLPRAVIDLDPTYYKFIDDLDARFPEGAPSLLGCSRLTIRGDVRFERDVILQGEVAITNKSRDQKTIQKGTLLKAS